MVPVAGFTYDEEQDIFYSSMDAWQRQYGYCRLYDEALAPLSMVVDCEPIYFDYAGKHWLIEFWKGQYGMTTGCEVGIYNTSRPEINIPGLFSGAFYNCVSSEDMLNIYIELNKNGKTLFSRLEKHWWLTGFILAEFSEPEELSVKIRLSLKDEAMLDAFLAAMKEAGYSDREWALGGNTVTFIFDRPRTAQPVTRTGEFSQFIQRKNKFLCDWFNELSRGEKDTPAKIEAIGRYYPFLYNEAIDIGGTKKIWDRFRFLVGFLPKE